MIYKLTKYRYWRYKSKSVFLGFSCFLAAIGQQDGMITGISIVFGPDSDTGYFFRANKKNNWKQPET